MMRVLLIGLVVLALFVGVVLGTYTLLQHYDPLRQPRPAVEVVVTPTLPSWMQPTTQPVIDIPIPPTPTPGIVSPPTPAMPLSINMTADKRQYRIGDALVLTASANQACYLMIYDVAPDGKIGRLFPNSSVGDARLFPAERRRIPRDADEIPFEIEGPPGSGYLHAVCSWKSVSGMFEIYQTIATFNAALQQQVYTHPARQWTEMKIPYQITR